MRATWTAVRPKVSGCRPAASSATSSPGASPPSRSLRDDVAVAFLDKSPLFPGTRLVVPVRHVETLADLAAHEIGPYFERVQAIAAAVPAGVRCRRHVRRQQQRRQPERAASPRARRAAHERRRSARLLLAARGGTQTAKPMCMPSVCAAALAAACAEPGISTSCKCNDSFRCIHVVRVSLMSTACMRRVAVRRALERENSNIHTQRARLDRDQKETHK